jgi:hypothetical protein
MLISVRVSEPRESVVVAVIVDVFAFEAVRKIDVVHEHVARVGGTATAAAEVASGNLHESAGRRPNVDRTSGISVENSSKYGPKLLSNRDADSIRRPPATTFPIFP